MADKWVLNGNALTGGAEGALDSYDTTSLPDGSQARIDIGINFYTYTYDSSSVLSESSPEVIAPDTGPGRWILSNVGIDIIQTQVFS